jgi:excinuclease ABC subunit C
MRTLGITPPFTIALAKPEGAFYVPGEDHPRRLARRSYALRLLQYVRDEAHRFAQQYHHLLRSKAALEE